MAEPRRLIVKLSSASGKIFEVAEAVALQSGLLKNVMEDVGITNSLIPLPNVSSDVLQQVLQHCKRCMDRTSSNIVEDLLRGPILYANKIVWKVNMKNLYDLIMAANYMQIETLLHQMYHIVARMIAKKTCEEVREIFQFENDFARRGEESLIRPNETQILASFIGSLPMELHLEIKIKFGQRFHHGDYSPWQYDANSQTLTVVLANNSDVQNMYTDQIAIILLYIDLGLVNTLVLQTYCVMFSPLSREALIEEVYGKLKIDVFEVLINGIDMSKIENFIFYEEATY